MKDPRITWETDHNTRAWTWEDWWLYRGVCACGHPSIRHMEIGGVCHGVIGRARKPNDGSRRDRRADHTMPCQCRKLRPVLLTRNSGAVFRRAIRPGEVHPFTSALGRTKPENILEWAPGFPRCEFPGGCDVVNIANLQMYYLANDRAESAMACPTHRPAIGANLGSGSHSSVGVSRHLALPTDEYGTVERSFPMGVSGAELLRALGAPKAAENPEIAARFGADRIGAQPDVDS